MSVSIVATGAKGYRDNILMEMENRLNLTCLKRLHLEHGIQMQRHLLWLVIILSSYIQKNDHKEVMEHQVIAAVIVVRCS